MPLRDLVAVGLGTSRRDRRLVSGRFGECSIWFSTGNDGELEVELQSLAEYSIMRLRYAVILVIILRQIGSVGRQRLYIEQLSHKGQNCQKFRQA